MSPDPVEDPDDPQLVPPPPVEVAPSATGVVAGSEDDLVEAPAPPEAPS